MINSDYELRIISLGEDSNGKNLKKYKINGEDVVGIYEGEPFAIEFKNKTWSKVQIKLSVDGTDISTGSLASTSPDGDMFVCDPYGTVRLKAWPESSKGGAEFLFGKVEDSVAANTHGNVSGKGLVAVAVFIEGHSSYSGINWGGVQLNAAQNSGIGNFGMIHNSGYTNSSNSVSGGILRSKSIMPQTVLGSRISSADSINTYDVSSASVNIAECSENLAVGAGDYVAQEIVKVAGLTKPILNTTISVKYESWNSLRSKVRALQKQVVNKANPAFPGDVPLEIKMIDLKNTPKGRNKSRKPTRTPDLQRF